MYINEYDFIKTSNVVSKQYIFNYKNIESVIVDFIKTVDKNNLTPKGKYFYSINNIPLDGNVAAEFFMEVKEELIENLEDLKFHSYFSIDNMISTCIYDDFEEKTEEAYFNLIKYIDDNKLSQITPFFNVVSGDRSLQYAFIKVGVKNI